MTKSMKFLVTGATGKQGGAVARKLLADGHEVRAFTRNADSDAAKALAAAGAKIATGKLEDAASVTSALQGMDAVFAMGTPFGPGGDKAETLQGVTVADAAKAAGVHIVYTSVGSADKGTKIPHFDSKYEVEKHIAKIGAKATILAPVYFMENVWFSRAQLKEGVFATPLSPNRKLAQIAVADIAAAAVAALESPEKYAGKRYDLVGDELSGAEAVEILSRVTGKKFSYFQVPMEMIKKAMGDDGVAMYEWFERVGYTIDHATLKRDFPTVTWHTFETWAREQDWKALFAG
jgi:uncharacterized protein YbjT (DUF2867 family)